LRVKLTSGRPQQPSTSAWLIGPRSLVTSSQPLHI
jgi:hypothetical protein